MIKNIFYLFLIVLFLGCSSKENIYFSEPALQDMVISVDNKKLTFREILNNNKGKTILIDIWASWCKDCIYSFPTLKKLEKKYTNVAFVYLSVDRGTRAWKRSIKKYNLGGQHYNFPKGQKDGDFVDFIELWWIPRYMVIDKKGKIIVFNIKNPTDKDIIKELNKTL